MHTHKKGGLILYILENDDVKLTADLHGAELHSLQSKASKTEYIWNGNPDYWKYHAPFLFPFVGRCQNNEFRIGTKTYTLPQHGFARISDFTCTEETDDTLTFELTANDTTRQQYPYEFTFRIQYILAGRTVTVRMTAENNDTQPMPFSFGAHPAFRCPIEPDDTLEDCYLEFSERETAGIYPIVPGGCLSPQKEPFLKDAVLLPLSQELFQHDALVFDDLQSRTITIRSKNNTKSLTMDFHEFPWFGIWSPVKGAPFVCLEPWLGHADFADFQGDFFQKDAIVVLDPGQSLTRSYTLHIEEQAE